MRIIRRTIPTSRLEAGHADGGGWDREKLSGSSSATRKSEPPPLTAAERELLVARLRTEMKRRGT